MKHFKIDKTTDGEGNDSWGVYRIGEDEPVAVWSLKREAEADVRELSKAIDADESDVT